MKCEICELEEGICICDNLNNGTMGTIYTTAQSSLSCLCPKCSEKFIVDWKELSKDNLNDWNNGILVCTEGEGVISKQRVREAIEKIKEAYTSNMGFYSAMKNLENELFGNEE